MRAGDGAAKPFFNPTRKCEALVSQILRILLAQARPYFYIGRNCIHSHLRGEFPPRQEKELTLSLGNRICYLVIE
jgi:hypothetical protein